LQAGIAPGKIVYSGVGKRIDEIDYALQTGIRMLNLESVEELHLVHQRAETLGKRAPIAIRVNPDVDPLTHPYISTGLKKNKFGIDTAAALEAYRLAAALPRVDIVGIDCHIGSQITDLSSFEDLCVKAAELQEWFNKQGVALPVINVGGGLGINYQHPNHFPVADFEAYFRLFEKYLKLQENQTLHFELGRSMVAPCGSLITRVLYVKEGMQKKFLIVDAGMTDLIRPALYQAFHHMENISSEGDYIAYDVVGPICE
jgi:diaminopimelate decarboxylase